jgi:Dolichyl-phosphate-mannose-protein mannosyltransferase/Tetratricopeptide repeat
MEREAAALKRNQPTDRSERRRLQREERTVGPTRNGAPLLDAKVSASFPRWTRWILPSILILAFVLRLVYVLQSRASPFFAEPQMDAAYHVDWARALAEGRSFQPGPFFRAPLYPWFLSGVFWLFGESYLAPRIVQAGIGALGVGLVYLIGSRVFDRRVGWISALFAASYWVLIYFDAELLLPVLEVPLDLLAIWLSLRFGDDPTPRRAAVAGSAWGISAIVRPNVLLFAPVVGAWVAWIAFRASAAAPPLRSKFAAPAAFALGLLAPILPITAYNTFIGGDTVLISSQGGVNLWIGNNPQSDGSSAIVPGTRADWWGGYYDAIHQAEASVGRTLKSSEVSNWYTKKALDFVIENPSIALRQFLWKMRLFWTDWELGNNSDERFFAFRFGPVLRWLPLGFGVLGPLALIGFFCSSRRALRDFPLWGFLPVYMMSVVAFFVCSRFRVPVLPVLCIFAAHTCITSVDLFRRKRLGALTARAFAFAVLSFGIRDVPRQIDRSESNGLWLLGVHEVQHANWEAGADYFQQAIAAKPRNVYALRDLGSVMTELGRFSEAEASFRSALEVRSDDPTTWRGLVNLELKQGRFAEAKASARQAIAVAPYSAGAQFDLGFVAAVESKVMADRSAPAPEVEARREEALQAFRAALGLHPPPEQVFEYALAAGRVLVSLGRWHEAIETLSLAVQSRQAPDAEGELWRCHELLLQALFQDGQATEAQSRAESLRKQFPSEPSAAELARKYGRR